MVFLRQGDCQALEGAQWLAQARKAFSSISIPASKQGVTKLRYTIYYNMNESFFKIKERE